MTFSRPSIAAKHFATRAAYNSARCPCIINLSFGGVLNDFQVVIGKKGQLELTTKYYKHRHNMVKYHNQQRNKSTRCQALLYPVLLIIYKSTHLDVYFCLC